MFGSPAKGKLEFEVRPFESSIVRLTLNPVVGTNGLGQVTLVKANAALDPDMMQGG